MSVILTIRNKFGKIAGAVIAIALIGFIISDARNGTFGNLFGGHDNTVIKVDGQKIEPREYQERIKEYETLYSIYSNQGRPLDDAARAQMDEQVVQMIVYEAAIGEQCDKLGIQTTKDEEKELIYGQNAHPLIRQFAMNGQQIFVNPETNQFDPARVKGIEQQLTQNPQADPSGKILENLEIVKKYVIRMNRINKFNDMYTGSVYVPMFLTKRAATDQTQMASIRYVKVPFTSVADADVKVTDDDIKAYMQKHSAMFESDQPTRSIEYISFDINPSSADTARALSALNDIKADFTATKDNKTFVNSKSDEANSYNEAYYNKRTFLSKYADTILSQPVGSVFGPYYENGSYRLAKIVDRKTLPDSAKVRHILVQTKQRGQDVRTDSAAKMRIDSAIALINAGANFDSVVNMYSDDEPSKKTKGEYTFTLQQRPAISKEFGDFAFEGSKGEKKTVKVSSDAYAGYHYIEILDQNGVAPSTQMAIITKTLAPSDSTVNAIYGKANEFAGKNPTGAEFDATVKKMNMDKRMGDNVKESSFAIQGLGSAREVVRWMYDHKVGDVSGVFQLGEQRYVVAKLSAINEKGLMAITATNRPMLEQRVRDEKKAAMIQSKYKGASLESIAGGTSQQVQQSDSVTLGASYIPNLGYEPKVVGYTFYSGFQPNTVSPGIKGQGGVYFISVLNRTNLPSDPNMMQMMMMQMRRQQVGQLQNAIGQMLQQDVNKMADVKYNTANF
jgi:peptidyl-prolyl cis-trans isomerase D